MVEEKKVENKQFVIDASICEILDFRRIFDDLVRHVGTNTFVITSVTLNELDHMQRFTEEFSINSKYVLDRAAEDDAHFKLIELDESSVNTENPGDCIVDYCLKNVDDVILLTSDEVMSLKARRKKVENWLFPHRLK